MRMSVRQGLTTVVKELFAQTPLVAITVPAQMAMWAMDSIALVCTLLVMLTDAIHSFN